MHTHVKPDGTPFTPFVAQVIGSQLQDVGRDRTYAHGVLIVERRPEANVQLISLWLRDSMTCLEGTTLIDVESASPKLTGVCKLEESWAPMVQLFEQRLEEELGAGWQVRIHVTPFGDHPSRLRRV